jgi:hypothetical protein
LEQAQVLIAFILTKIQVFVNIKSRLERFKYGSTQSKNVESKDTPSAVPQHETYRAYNDKMQHLRQQGSFAPNLPEMRLLQR